MADSERTTTLPVSRRRLLAGAGVVATLGAASTLTGATPHPDAALLALGGDLERAWEKEKDLWKDAPDDTPQEAFDAQYAATKVIVRQIIDTPASTLDGLKVKALAIRWCYCDELDGVSDSISGDTTDRKIAASIICDLLRGPSPPVQALAAGGAV